MSRLDSWLVILTCCIVLSTEAQAQNGAPLLRAPIQHREDNAENIALPLAGAMEPQAPASQGNPLSVGGSLTTVVGGLAVCLAVFFLFVWITRRHAPGGLAPLPKEVVESLGRMSLDHRHQLQLIRVGAKLVLLNVTTTSAEPLTEIRDAAEVERLVGLCRQTSPDSVTASFREVLSQYEADPAASGFLGDTGESDWELATRSRRGRSTPREARDG